MTRYRVVLLRLLYAACAFCLLVAITNRLNQESYVHHGVSIIWLPNGLMVGILLCTRRRQWPAFLLMGFLLDVAANIHGGQSLKVYLSAGLCNVVEILLASSLMFPAVARRPDFTDTRQFRSLLLYGILLAPAVASFLVALCFLLFEGTPLTDGFRFWFAADALGIATVTPLYLSWHRYSLRSANATLELAGLLSLLAGVTFLAFRNTASPSLWVVLLCLLLVGMRQGFATSALGLLVVTCIGGHLTVTYPGAALALAGSSAKIAGGAMVHRILVLQVFLGASMLALYVTEVTMARTRRIHQELRASEMRFRLLTEASSDLVILNDLLGGREYVSPAVTPMLGWTPEEFRGYDYRASSHAEDVSRIRQFLEDIKNGGERGTIEFRSRKRDGSYLWVESNVKLIRDPQTHEMQGFVAVVRDISDRKIAEEEMKKAVESAELLAMMDGLTGIPNRRFLDQVLQREWLLARRDRSFLSLLLIDVDHFKLYNDYNGHLAGDACLRRIAQVMQGVLHRPTDLLARYGGEEFVIILPHTGVEGAREIADKVRRAVEGLNLPHHGNPHEIVTVSIGCASEMPGADRPSAAILQAADAALYRAKANGRNRMQVTGDEVTVH